MILPDLSEANLKYVSVGNRQKYHFQNVLSLAKFLFLKRGKVLCCHRTMNNLLVLSFFAITDDIPKKCFVQFSTQHLVKWEPDVIETLTTLFWSGNTLNVLYLNSSAICKTLYRYVAGVNKIKIGGLFPRHKNGFYVNGKAFSILYSNYIYLQ